jgi:hypothetical protein
MEAGLLPHLTHLRILRRLVRIDRPARSYPDAAVRVPHQEDPPGTVADEAGDRGNEKESGPHPGSQASQVLRDRHGSPPIHSAS